MGSSGSDVKGQKTRVHIFAGCAVCDDGGMARDAWSGHGEARVRAGLKSAQNHAKKTNHEVWADVTTAYRWAWQ